MPDLPSPEEIAEAGDDILFMCGLCMTPYDEWHDIPTQNGMHRRCPCGRGEHIRLADGPLDLGLDRA